MTPWPLDEIQDPLVTLDRLVDSCEILPLVRLQDIETPEVIAILSSAGRRCRRLAGVRYLNCCLSEPSVRAYQRYLQAKITTLRDCAAKTSVAQEFGSKRRQKATILEGAGAVGERDSALAGLRH